MQHGAEDARVRHSGLKNKLADRVAMLGQNFGRSHCSQPVARFQFTPEFDSQFPALSAKDAERVGHPAESTTSQSFSRIAFGVVTDGFLDRVPLGASFFGEAGVGF